jgi:glucose-6-phosphate isomerase
VKLLLQLAEESSLRSRIDAMFRGDKINITENRIVASAGLACIWALVPGKDASDRLLGRRK